MTHPDLSQQLDTLHQQLQSLDTVDETTGEQLRRLSQDIQRLTAGTTDGDLSLSDQARELEARFEADHPSASGVLREIINSLARMGL